MDLNGISNSAAYGRGIPCLLLSELHPYSSWFTFSGIILQNDNVANLKMTNDRVSLPARDCDVSQWTIHECHLLIHSVCLPTYQGTK